MRIRTASDVFATAIAWLPFLAVLVGVMWVLATGLVALEQRSFGSELFVKNSQTSNLPEWAQESSRSDRLQAALDSGDTGRMAAELDAAAVSG